MLYKPKTIEDHILSLLKGGSLGTTDLLSQIKEVRPTTTKQALYQTLRKLKKEEVVVLRSKLVSLSHIWINKMSEYFSGAQGSYGSSTEPSEDFLKLEDGEKISYTFKSPEHTDMFWGHAFGILSNRVSKSIFIYNPHEWFIVAREESEKHLFQEIVKKDKELNVLVGNRDDIDKEQGIWFSENNIQYFATVDKIFDKRNYYLNIFDDFIIEAWLDEKTTQEIDKFYKEENTLNESSKQRLISVISNKGKNKLTISRNARRSAKLKNIFKKYFLIKVEK